MRSTWLAAVVLLTVAAVLILPIAAGAAPSLRVNKGPVVPIPSWTGPPGDPHATLGQWFKDRRSGLEVFRPHEFYDNIADNGGSPAPMGSNCIKGIATNVVKDMLTGNIISFDVNATITNDLPEGSGGWQPGSNSHGESMASTADSYRDYMWNVKLTASFAVDMNVLPTFWQPPYVDRQPYIIALNHDELAWYCWTPNNPVEKFPFGAYYVPTWDFGTIGPDQPPVTKLLKFGVAGAGLPNTDSRYNVITTSMQSQKDMFANRTKSLKCSDWIDTCFLDSATAPYPGPSGSKSSDVSVFHEMYPETDYRDWGDAPDGPYPTKALSGGANHIIQQGFFLGWYIDGEADGQPNANATGDDINFMPDEDGVFPMGPLIPGQPTQVQVFLTAPATMTGLLDAWIDFGGDGSWLTPGDQVAASLALVPGWNTFTVNTPATAIPGTQAFARFRLSTVGNLPPTGMAKDGEVEDYAWVIEEQPHLDQDWGDAPEGGSIFNYPTTNANGGAFHTMVKGLCLGVLEDAEPDGQPDPNALGDDNNSPIGMDDEDGVVWNTPLMVGQGAQVTVNCTVLTPTPAYLNAWLDFGIDGSWGQLGDQIITNAVVSNGTNTFTFVVPTTAGAGTTFARFRLSTVRGLGYGGGAQDGEVEDEKVIIEPAKDFGDAPEGATAPGYPTRRINNGPWHKIVPGFTLGANIDAELDGQPTANADGDDNNPPLGIDDEDGITFNTGLIPVANASITVTTSIPTGVSAYLDGWIDFNGDGNWTTLNDRIFTAQAISGGAVNLTFPVPASASVGIKSFARFRLSSYSKGLPFVGGYSDGEVEDYVVMIGYKWMQKPDLATTGIDVCASATFMPYILADDYQCKVTGPITDIHLWGSWRHDILPGNPGSVGNPANVTFTLSIHEDIPAGPQGDYSRPGRVLWWRTFDASQFMVHQHQGNLREGWMYPPSEWEPIGDSVCWQYDFYINESPFIQRGTIEKPITYWLDVQAMPQGQEAEFGWKTSLDNWNDDAVWGQGYEPLVQNWSPLKYPQGHPLWPQSIDLAFAITGSAADVDWGDAPDRPYPTLAASTGANHIIKPGFCLGKLIDGEANGLPNPTATGDDLNNQPDEDGLLLPLPALVPGQNATIMVTLTGPIGSAAFLDGWIDFNADGSWGTLFDQIAAALPLAVGANPVTFPVPRTWTPGAVPTFARFRLSSSAVGLPFTGPANDGEVEDYAVTIQPDRGTLTFNQFIALKDHFWWPGHPSPSPYNEMISMTVSADSVEPVKWDSLNLTMFGGAVGDVGKVSVWQDVDADGRVSLGDTWLGAVLNPFGAVTVNLAMPPVIPAGASIAALVAYQMSGAGAPGTIYQCQATSAAGTGQTSLLPAYITGLPIGSCRKILAPKPISIGEAKKLTIGQPFLLVGKEVTANFLGIPEMNLFYIEEKNRSSGIGVKPTIAVWPVSIGDNVSVLGTCNLLNGTELVVFPQEILVGANMLPYLTAVGMNNKWTGGGDFGGQPAVYDNAWTGLKSVGLNNVGMLVRTWGLVTHHDSAFRTPSITGPMFWINDGSDLRDGFWHPNGGQMLGVACLYLGPMGAFPDMGEYWGVTGIMRSIPNLRMPAQAVRLLVLTEYPMPH